MLPGSVASHVVLGAPDIVVLSLPEFAEQARRISRASGLPLMVDADHGYGNALNVRRTVEELEAAGVAALTIEDTLLPRRFGGPEAELIPREEFAGKLRAALDARVDPQLAIVGRSGSLQRAGLDEAVERVRVASACGVDAIFILGTRTLAEVEALYAAATVPLVLNMAPGSRDELAAKGVRIILQGNLPYFVAMQALYDAYRFIKNGGMPEDLRDQALKPELQAAALAEADYATWARDYLGPTKEPS
jgi:carboxyvinyl-carboxyphosphonate phosphorylmutase